MVGGALKADAPGRVVHAWNPDGVAHTGALAGPAAAKVDLTYPPAGSPTTPDLHATDLLNRSEFVGDSWSWK